MNSDPCCGVPVQCLRPDDECKHREAHHADRGLYLPLADAVLDAPTTYAKLVGGGPANAGMGDFKPAPAGPLAHGLPLGPANAGMGDFKPATPEQVQAWLNTPVRETIAQANAAKIGATGGAKLKGNHYYRVAVDDPISGEVPPYVAECADIIEALGMTFNEGEAFKAIWRLAAGRTLGLKKNDPQYDADKAAHYGGRIAVQVARNAARS